MIRKDREVCSLHEMVEIVAKCQECVVALNGVDGFPYLLPLNFGYKFDGKTLVLYFHSAVRGMKHELMARDNRASFEVDCSHELIHDEARGYCTMNYESVIGQGLMSYVEDDEEKIEALTLLTDRFHEGHFEFNRAAAPRTSVYKLTVTSLTGKRKVRR